MRARPLVWSLFLILAITVISLGATVATGTTPLLGLDLKGGVSVTEKPVGKVTSATLTESVNIIDRRVNGSGVSNAEVSTQGKDIVIELPGAKDDTSVLALVGKTAQLFFRPQLCQIMPYVPGIKQTTTTTKPPTGTTTTTVPSKAKGSTTTSGHVTTTSASKVTPKGAPSSKTTTTKAKSAKAALVPLNARADQPVSAPSSARSPATSTTAATKGSTTTTAASVKGKGATGKTTTTVAGATTSSTGTTSTTTAVTTTTNPVEGACNLTQQQQEVWKPPVSTPHGDTPAASDKSSSYVVLPFYSDTSYSQARYVLGPAEMSGTVIKSAAANLNSQSDQWEVDLTFTGKGANKFNQYATSHYECYEEDTADPPNCAFQAIELDGVVYSDPYIEAASFPTGATISGSFTSSEASQLALELNYGSLPVRFVAQDISLVSPEIGTASLKAGAVAGAVAVLLVLIYLVWYYRALGLVVVLGIVMSGALLYSITDLLSQTNGLALTLSGVIGLIVSVGVTADSCVVYFERLKEEIRSGRTVRTSVEKGFNRAFRTILAADFSSFVAALILYSLTVGDVRGFAFFLGLATLLNVITTYFFTRPLVILIGRRAAMTKAGVLGVSRGLGAAALTP